MKKRKPCKVHDWKNMIDHQSWEVYYQWTECTKCGKQQTPEDREALK